MKNGFRGGRRNERRRAGSTRSRYAAASALCGRAPNHGGMLWAAVVSAEHACTHVKDPDATVQRPQPWAIRPTDTHTHRHRHKKQTKSRAMGSSGTLTAARVALLISLAALLPAGAQPTAMPSCDLLAACHDPATCPALSGMRASVRCMLFLPALTSKRAELRAYQRRHPKNFPSRSGRQQETSQS